MSGSRKKQRITEASILYPKQIGEPFDFETYDKRTSGVTPILSTSDYNEREYIGELSLYDVYRKPIPLMDSNVTRKISVPTSRLNSELKCPVCLGNCIETRVGPCLHRFCKDCIVDSLYKLNNCCPMCREKISTKRTLKADFQWDQLIACIYPNVAQHEKAQDELILKQNQRQAKENREKLKSGGLKKVFADTIEKAKINSSRSTIVSTARRNALDGDEFLKIDFVKGRGVVKVLERPYLTLDKYASVYVLKKYLQLQYSNSSFSNFVLSVTTSDSRTVVLQDDGTMLIDIYSDYRFRNRTIEVSYALK